MVHNLTFYFYLSLTVLFIFLNCSDYKPTPAIHNCTVGETIAVDRIMLHSDSNNKLCVKLLTRHTRRPEVSFKCI